MRRIAVIFEMQVRRLPEAAADKPSRASTGGAGRNAPLIADYQIGPGLSRWPLPERLRAADVMRQALSR